MTDDPVRTRLTLVDGPEISFQDVYFVHRHAVAVRSVRFEGADGATPAPGVLDAIGGAEVVVVCLQPDRVDRPDPRRARAGRRPGRPPGRGGGGLAIVAGAALKGPADRLMTELGHEATVVGVAHAYAEFVGTLVVDDADAALAAEVEACGVRCIVAPTVITTARGGVGLAPARRRPSFGRGARRRPMTTADPSPATAPSSPAALSVIPVAGMGEIGRGDDWPSDRHARRAPRRRRGGRHAEDRVQGRGSHGADRPR